MFYGVLVDDLAEVWFFLPPVRMDFKVITGKSEQPGGLLNLCWKNFSGEISLVWLDTKIRSNKFLEIHSPTPASLAEGEVLRFWQNLLDPVQQLVADGCHLTRDTLSLIEAAQFASLSAQKVQVKGASIIKTHVIGIARTA